MAMTNSEYHAHPALGSSGVKSILKNPYSYLHPQEMTGKNLDIGSAIHKLILEPHDFEKEFAVAPSVDRRTKAGKEAWAEFVGASVGKTVLAAEDYETAKGAAESVLYHPEAQFLLSDGVAESSHFADLDGVACKCRPDYYRERDGIVVDVKSTEDASPDGFAKAVANFGYYIQDPFYCDVLLSSGKPVSRFIFIAVERKPPHMVGIYELDHVARDFGRDEYRRAFKILSDIDNYKRPLYVDTATGDVVQTIELPSYVFYRKNASS